jgi:hypothetical protein
VIDESVEEDWDMSVVEAIDVEGAFSRTDGGVEAIASDDVLK